MVVEKGEFIFIKISLEETKTLDATDFFKFYISPVNFCLKGQNREYIRDKVFE